LVGCERRSIGIAHGGTIELFDSTHSNNTIK